MDLQRPPLARQMQLTHRPTRLGPPVWVLAAWLLASCGSSTSNGSPCESEPTPSACTTTCTVDSNCAAGFYCGGSGTCTADCATAGGACGEHGICAEDGRCVSPDSSDAGKYDDIGGDGGTDAKDCPNVALNLEPISPTVILLIDQSGSMRKDFAGTFTGTPRWTEVQTALTDPSNGVVTLLQDQVRFGLTTYRSIGGFAGGTCPMLLSDPPDFNNLSDIQQILNDNFPDDRGDTPTGESIQAVVQELNTNPPPPDSPPIIVLATDGEPDTCLQANPKEGQGEAVAAARAAHEAGIDLYILSVGSDIAMAHMQDMANAGVGASSGAPFFRANSQNEMVEAFNQIIRGTRSCTLELGGTVNTGRAGDGTVAMDIGQGPRSLVFEVDWEIVDSSTLQLIGAACADFLRSDSVSLNAEFPCGVVID